jgi:hypothetical protein
MSCPWKIPVKKLIATESQGQRRLAHKYRGLVLEPKQGGGSEHDGMEYEEKGMKPLLGWETAARVDEFVLGNDDA